MDDKVIATIEYLIQCPSIQDSPLYFNFINAKDDDKQFVITGNDRILDATYIDGSIQKRFTFTIMDYRSIAYQELPRLFMDTNENVQEYLDVQALADWITEQNLIKNFPDFGEDCVVDTIFTKTDNPNLNGIDSNVKPALAKYSLSIQIDYLDKSHMIWNK